MTARKRKEADGSAADARGKSPQPKAVKQGKKQLPEELRKYCWKPGESGNPKGRPKRKTLTERLIERLDAAAETVPYARKLVEKLRDNPDEMTLGDIIVDATCLLAIRGNAQILKELWERMDGKVKDVTEIQFDEPRVMRTPIKGPPIRESET